MPSDEVSDLTEPYAGASFLTELFPQELFQELFPHGASRSLFPQETGYETDDVKAIHSGQLLSTCIEMAEKLRQQGNDAIRAHRTSEAIDKYMLACQKLRHVICQSEPDAAHARTLCLSNCAQALLKESRPADALVCLEEAMALVERFEFADREAMWKKLVFRQQRARDMLAEADMLALADMLTEDMLAEDMRQREGRQAAEARERERLAAERLAETAAAERAAVEQAAAREQERMAAERAAAEEAAAERAATERRADQEQRAAAAAERRERKAA